MAKKNKAAKGSKRGKGKEVDVTARLCGAVAGLPLLVIACWMLVQGQADFVTAGQLALGGLLLALVVEKGVVPLGRFIARPPGR